MKLRPSMLRTISPTEPTHWVLIAGALVAAAAAWLRADVQGGSAHVNAAMVAAAAVFAAWALARELAPDRQAPAWLALLAAVVFVSVHRHLTVDLAGSFCVVLGARMALGSTGLRPGLGDIVAIGAIAGWSADHQPGLVAVGALVIGAAVPAFAGSAQASLQQVRDRLVALATALAGIVVATIVAVSNWPLPAGIEPPRYVELVALSLAGGVSAVVWCRQPEAEPDHVSRLARSRAAACAMSRSRLRFARLLTTAVLAVAFLLVGPPAVSALAPAWLGLAGAGVVVAVSRAALVIRWVTRR